MEYSQVILNFMESKGVTGYRLAKATGISESLFGKWRNNPTSKIDTLTITKIASYFQVSLDELLGIDNKEKPAIVTDDELTNEFREFPEHLKQKAIEYAKYVAALEKQDNA